MCWQYLLQDQLLVRQAARALACVILPVRPLPPPPPLPHCRHTHRSPFSQALLTAYFLMWSEDSLPQKRFPSQGRGPSLFLVGLTHLCLRRHQGVTLLLVLLPGLDLFKCSSVCRPRRQRTHNVTPHRLSGHLSVGHTHFVKGRHSPATHH